MNWTTQPPTSPGWYWLRGPQANNGNGEATHGEIIVDVHISGRERSDKLGFRYQDSGWFEVDEMQDAQWAGPLPLPEDTRND